MAYLRKVNNGWQININYTDPKTGKRKRKTKVINDTKPVAESKMADMIKKRDKGTLIRNNNFIFKEWLNEWLKDKKPDVEYNTYRNYESIIQTHVIPALGKLNLQEIKPYHIKQYITKKRENGRLKGEGGLSE